jgi:hypothetical protein
MADASQAAADSRGVSDEEKHRLLQMSEISLWLDSYDDIFSDFDPRPYSERSLSDDFLNESKKAAREKISGTIDLKFLLPKGARDPKLEEVIKKRLHEHFRKHHVMLEGEVRGIRRGGVVMVVAGMALMMLATFIQLNYSDGFVTQLLTVVFEPSGWFITWFGFDKIFYHARQKSPDLEFYSKMSRVQMHFLEY